VDVWDQAENMEWAGVGGGVGPFDWYRAKMFYDELSLL
jgi:hypothetical protein